MRRPFFIDDPSADEDSSPNPTTEPGGGNESGAVRARLRALRANPTARRIGSVGAGLAVVSGVVVAGIHAGTPHTTVLPDVGRDPAALPQNLPPAPLPSRPTSPPISKPPASVRPPASASVPPSRSAGSPIAAPPAVVPAPPHPSIPPSPRVSAKPVAPSTPVAPHTVSHASSPPRRSSVHVVSAAPHSTHPARRSAPVAAPVALPPGPPATPRPTFRVAVPQWDIAVNDFPTFAGTLVPVERPCGHDHAGLGTVSGIESYLDGLMGSITVGLPMKYPF